jgi:hypothetical protein
MERTGYGNIMYNPHNRHHVTVRGLNPTIIRNSLFHLWRNPEKNINNRNSNFQRIFRQLREHYGKGPFVAVVNRTLSLRRANAARYNTNTLRREREFSNEIIVLNNKVNNSKKLYGNNHPLTQQYKNRATQKKQEYHNYMRSRTSHKIEITMYKKLFNLLQ